jgi:hypothetical protein
MLFEHLHFLGAHDIVVSKHQHQPGPQGYQSQARKDHWQEMVDEAARESQYV